MRVLIFTLLIFLLMPSESMASGKRFKDRDWTVATIDNCGFPAPTGPNQSVSWVKLNEERMLQFTLREGERGKCPTDNKARNRAPYWERAEVRQDSKMKLGKVQKITFDAVFVEGFVGDRETFFQIHSWNNGCPAYPLVMMKSLNGRLAVLALHKVSGNGLGDGRGQHREVQSTSLRIKSIYYQKLHFVLTMDTTSSPGRLSVTMNGQTIVNNAATDFAPCAAPHVKLGVYRPGGKSSGTSTVLFDKLTVD